MQTVPFGAGGAIPRPLFCPTARGGKVRGGKVVVAALAGVFLTAFPVLAEPLPGKIVQASWYGKEFAHRRTASGDRFDPHGMTGAHRTLPLGSKVRVTNLQNGRSVLVTITDRGPYVEGRIIDLSQAAAYALGMIDRGLVQVRIDLLAGTNRSRYGSGFE